MSQNESFVHLHVHSEYSMLDGAARIKPLVQEALKQGADAIAITDHGNMFGAFEMWKSATQLGIKPIIGTEAYLTPGTRRTDRTRVKWGNGASDTSDDVSGGGAFTHMTMWAATTEGMHNLFRLSSYSSLEGYYFKPRMDRDLLSRYGKGIIASTGCPSSEVQTRLRLGQYDLAKQAAADFRDIFGKENFYVELMDHGLNIERRVFEDLIRLAKELDLPLVATNDLHYIHAADAQSHEALLCVQSASTLNDPGRFKFDSQEFYLKTPAQMRHLFADYPEACDNTLAISERCEVTFDTEANFMPHFPTPESYAEESWFMHEIQSGLARRYPDGISEEIQERAAYEASVISQMGFAGYFLIVADFINWSKKNNIRVGPGRGSGAGSMAAYAMGITDLDPIEHGLIFERFLNPERVSMPDFDVDFDDRHRGEVIKYVTEKYGDERVAQIVTFGTIKAKQALKDACRVLGLPYGLGEKLTKAMPPAVMGKDIPLEGIFNKQHSRYKEATDIRTLVEEDPQAKQVFDTALGLENLKRQWGVHAAGVIMSSEPLLDIIPVMRREQDGQIVTQFDYPTCEALGLIKMDFLGLRNLTIINDALENIEANQEKKILLEELSLDDPKAYELLATGDTLGVFQLDGGPMRSLIKLMKPDNFEDISALIALYRPGPMGANSHTNYALRKNKQQAIVPIHKEFESSLEDILGTTYGLIIYQEQVMSIAQKVAGFSLGQADILRRAMGKKKKEELDKQFENFSSGMRNNGYSTEAIDALWQILLPFSDYAFNKAHSAAYGVISYWTAYLKAHYPSEYMAALLTSVGDSKEKMAIYLNECRRMGIKVLPPDVNESTLYFSAVGKDIRFGLGAVRNVGQAVVENIVALRQEDGKFSSFHNFLTRVSAQTANKRTIDSLIKSGSFDSLGNTRRSLFEIHESAIDQATHAKKRQSNGDVGFDFESLWDDPEDSFETSNVPKVPEWTKKEKLAFERDMLGLYVSDHPLAGLEKPLFSLAPKTITDIFTQENPTDGETVTVAGLLTQVQNRIAKKSGNPYAQITVEDFGAEIKIMFMGRSYQEFVSLFVSDTIVVVQGRLSVRDDGITIHAFSLVQADIEQYLEEKTLTLLLPERASHLQNMLALQEIISRYPGEQKVEICLEGVSAKRFFLLPQRVSITGDLCAELKGLLGSSCITI